jgi:hypothetical protein
MTRAGREHRIYQSLDKSLTGPPNLVQQYESNKIFSLGGQFKQRDPEIQIAFFS